MEKTYNYFVSYLVNYPDNWGFGNCSLECDGPLSDYQSLKDAEERIKELNINGGKPVTGVIIINFRPWDTAEEGTKDV